MNKDRLEAAKKVELLILDIDGVLTDARLFFDNKGKEYKGFNTQDGLGIRLMQRIGVDVAVISGRTSKAVHLRMADLAIKLVYLGQGDKRQAFQDILQKTACEPENIAYVGDDLIDLPVLTQVGFPIAVGNANAAILPYVIWQTQALGGHGAVREVCDLIVQAKGKMDRIIASYCV